MTSQPWSLPDELRQLAESGETELVQEVLSVFQTDTAARLARLRSSLEADERAAVRHEAHAVKGSAGQVGAPEMAELCRQIESLAPAARGPIEELLEKLEAVFADVCRQMRAASRP